ncbi:uncharacterized protein FOMMEDRAFT_169239 [Fomitiporia mediterranea MF3/22]|uniref:uncharacterized protein n=1 Tax=Fomitiporia mediterranea (strain MF3/22) TaxID=694068 RepID=UPI00044098CE|nr:uncharacterized protein FOMMEDRAFT_169239 [Fomitiporia mediterranea MF3/22]EJD01035.1 hypothetical protein FOMMEDRAFT_169239 [Fomitiporia mediterranea MF3/22]
MVKLPPAVKHLLAQRNPQPFASPPVGVLNRLFRRTRTEAQQHNAVNGWLVLSTCTLLTANTPDAVGDLYRFATRDVAFSARLDAAAKMREAALKSSIFIGVPRTILSLAAMTEAFGDEVRSGLRREPRRSVNSTNVDEFLKRGQTLWNNIYDPHAEKLYNKLGSYHPDFITFIIQSYGCVLAPFDYPAPKSEEQGNLTRALGSVVGIACLRAEMHVGPQLISHVFGLLKARSEPELSDEDKWLSSDEGTEWVLRTVDQIYDVARGEVSVVEAKL